MRLAFFSACGFPWGGSEVLWTAVAKKALNERHDVLVSVFKWPNLHSTIHELAQNGATIVYRRRFYPSAIHRAKKKILNLFLSEGEKYTYNDYINRFKPDHIFFNLAGGDEIAIDSSDLMVFIKQTQIPFSVFYHNISTHKYLNKVQTENFRFLLQKTKYNFFTSKMQINLLSEQLELEIPNAVILCHPLRQIFNSTKSSLTNDVSNFCIIGNLVNRWKGQDMLINILAKEEWMHLNWHLNIYGEGSDREQLVKLIDKVGLNNKVTLHGYNKNVNKILETNDLVLIPSRQDSGPIVLYEAMMAGRPVVGSYMGAMPEYIETGVTGVLADSTDEVSFEKAMRTAWEQKEKWNGWGKNARLRMEKYYDFNAVNTLLNLITKI